LLAEKQLLRAKMTGAANKVVLLRGVKGVAFKLGGWNQSQPLDHGTKEIFCLRQLRWKWILKAPIRGRGLEYLAVLSWQIEVDSPESESFREPRISAALDSRACRPVLNMKVEI
jgi:hypothetical protein